MNAEADVSAVGNELSSAGVEIESRDAESTQCNR